MRLLIALLGLSLLACPGASRAAETRGVSGLYDGGLLIGFDPATQMTSGYFSSETGAGQFTCIFYLAGRLKGATAEISTYFPATPQERIAGQLSLGAPDHLRVRLQEEHGGCWNVQHFADDAQPADFTRETAYPWISVAVIRSDKAYFFDAPGAPAHRKAYVVRGDGVGVRAKTPGWLQVDFVGGARPVSGWIRQSDAFSTP